MIILFKDEKVIDVVKSIQTVENGIKVTRFNDKQVIYSTAMINNTEEIQGTPDIDFTKISDYTYENGVFTKKKKLVYTKKEFLDMFTQEQVVNIWSSSDVNVKYFVAVLTMVNEIRLDNDETKGAILYLKTQGLMTQSQYDSII